MAENTNFLGIQQVKKATFDSIIETGGTEAVKGYIWFVRDFDEGGRPKDETCQIYLGSRLYGEVNASVWNAIEEINTTISGITGDYEDLSTIVNNIISSGGGILTSGGTFDNSALSGFTEDLGEAVSGVTNFIELLELLVKNSGAEYSAGSGITISGNVINGNTKVTTTKEIKVTTGAPIDTKGVFGDTIPSGTTVQAILEKLLTMIINPTGVTEPKATNSFGSGTKVDYIGKTVTLPNFTTTRKKAEFIKVEGIETQREIEPGTDYTVDPDNKYNISVQSGFSDGLTGTTNGTITSAGGTGNTTVSSITGTLDLGTNSVTANSSYGYGALSEDCLPYDNTGAEYTGSTISFEAGTATANNATYSFTGVYPTFININNYTGSTPKFTDVVLKLTQTGGTISELSFEGNESPINVSGFTIDNLSSYGFNTIPASTGITINDTGYTGDAQAISGKKPLFKFTSPGVDGSSKNDFCILVPNRKGDEYGTITSYNIDNFNEQGYCVFVAPDGLYDIFANKLTKITVGIQLNDGQVHKYDLITVSRTSEGNTTAGHTDVNAVCISTKTLNQ